MAIIVPNGTIGLGDVNDVEPVIGRKESGYTRSLFSAGARDLSGMIGRLTHEVWDRSRVLLKSQRRQRKDSGLTRRHPKR